MCSQLVTLHRSSLITPRRRSQVARSRSVVVGRSLLVVDSLLAGGDTIYRVRTSIDHRSSLVGRWSSPRAYAIRPRRCSWLVVGRSSIVGRSSFILHPSSFILHCCTSAIALV